MRLKALTDLLEKKLKLDRRAILIVLVGLLGIVLLAVSELTEDKDTSEPQEKTSQLSEDNTCDKLEERLTELISSINGAGKTRVMITLDSTDENVYAVESKQSGDTDEREYVIVERDGEDDGLLIKVSEPQIRGVAVVCEGADSAEVRQAVTATVTAVLGISTNRVNIAKMKPNNGG